MVPVKFSVDIVLYNIIHQSMLQRLKEAEMFKEWEQQEDQVHKFNICYI